MRPKDLDLETIMIPLTIITLYKAIIRLLLANLVTIMIIKTRIAYGLFTEIAYFHTVRAVIAATVSASDETVLAAIILALVA